MVAAAEVFIGVWQVQGAKTRLSEVIEEANTKGPQIVTRHGAERPVILSIAEYRAVTAHKHDLRAYLFGGPKVDSFDVPGDNDTGREGSL